MGKKKEKREDDDLIAPKRKRSASERRRSLAEIIKMKVCDYKIFVFNLILISLLFKLFVYIIT